MGIRVGIVGCGTAGQASAVLLARAGHRVTVFERARELSPVGAGLLIQPTGMAVLSELGVLADVAAASTRIEKLHGVTASGRVILDLAYRDLSEGLFGLGVHRGTLFTLLQRVVAASGVNVCCGVEVVLLREQGEQRALVDSAGGEHGPFDLVIVADGSRSALRASTGLVRRARAYPWGALWFVAEDREGRYGDTLAQVYRGTGRMIGFLPSGIGPRRERTVSVFWSVRCDRVPRTLEQWKHEVRGLTDRADPILDQLAAREQLIFAAYQDVVMRRSFSGPVVFLGDAAHAMSPQLGQGANLALVDASVLARELGRGSIAEALVRFDAARRRNVRFYQFASRWMTPVFQSGWEWVAPGRDLFMGPLGRMGWFRREMLRSLAGVKTGLFRSEGVPLSRMQ